MGIFCHLFEATTFLPFSGISYIRGEENFGLEFAKILSEKLNQVRVKMGKFKQKLMHSK